ncbi:MAG: hypothetical protein ACRDPW_08180 [Mycobacteriales bacterium]
MTSVVTSIVAVLLVAAGCGNIPDAGEPVPVQEKTPDSTSPDVKPGSAREG